MVKLTLAALILLIPCVDAAAQQGRPLEVEVDWSAQTPDIDAEDALRRMAVRDKDQVVLRIRHFNFLHYTLHVSVDTRVEAAYAGLSNIWETAFGLVGFLGAAPAGATEFDQRLRKWRERLEQTEALTTPFKSEERYFGQSAFSPRSRQMDELVEASAALRTLVDRELPERREATRTAMLAQKSDLPALQAAFTAVDALHKEITEATRDFLRLSSRIVDGDTHFVSAYRVGTDVTVTLRGEPKRTGYGTRAITIDYLVQARRRLMYHLGYEMTRRTEASFDQISDLTGRRLYEVESTSDTAVGMSAFMSAEFASMGPNDRYGIQGTIGTALQKPFETVTLGISFRAFSRLLATVGARIASVEQGEAEVSQNLFERIRRGVQAAPTFAISVRAY